jgi:hypothetical protein
MTTTITSSTTQGVKAIKMTAEQVKADSKREYNPQIWEQKVDSYGKYENVQFFKISKDDIYSYDRFFVVYTLPEGLRLLSDFGYSSSLTNGGFYPAFISTLEIILDDNGDIAEYKMLEDGHVYIKINKIITSEGENVAMNNTPAARKYMIERTKSYGQIWTKEYFTA